MPRHSAQDRIVRFDRIYLNTEQAARELGMSIGRLRELARGYDGRNGRNQYAIPFYEENRNYYFNIEEVKQALDDIKRNRKYLRSL